MSERALAGLGVLVTRPSHQAAALTAAIRERGARAVLFPVVEIVPRSPQAVEADLAGLTEPDIVIYVSSNAVEHGLAWNPAGAIAAIGPSTAAAIEAAARIVDIRPASGYDSESLLAEPALNEVDGKTIRIVRGNGGRELLADTLRRRSANVEYLEVYERRTPDHSDDDIAALARRWQGGEIDVVTIMSTESLRKLLALLPESCRQLLARTPLVTPAARVIKEAHDRLPGWPVTLAEGPDAGSMVRAIATLGLHKPGRNS